MSISHLFYYDITNSYLFLNVSTITLSGDINAFDLPKEEFYGK